MLKKCADCKSKTIVIDIPEFQKTRTVFLYKCITKIEERSTTIKDKFITVKVVTKDKIYCSIDDLIKELNLSLSKCLHHFYNIKHQFKLKQEMKTNMTENEVMIEMDFSKNYLTKYG